MNYTVFGADEVWLPVLGFEAYFEISSRGRVNSLPRLDRRGRRVRGGIRKLHRNPAGYVCVTLKVDGVSHRKEIHWLVLEAFHGPKEDPRLHGCHYDDDKENNTPWNLRWDTPSENLRDAYRNGKQPRKRNIERPNCPHGHPYSGENVMYSAADGSAVCRTCRRHSAQKLRDKKRAATLE